MMYMFTGSAGVNPTYMILEVPLILAWRNAGYFGLDRYALNATWWRRHFGRVTEHAGQRRALAPLPAPDSLTYIPGEGRSSFGTLLQARSPPNR